MGTKVHCESFLPGYYSMRDLNEDSSGCSWPLYYGDNKNLANGQCYNGFPPRTIADPYFGYEKDAVRRTILEHEAVFKNQVYELHRLYRIQRDMMDELKRKEMNRSRIPVEASFSSSPLASQVTYDDARKWQMPGVPLANSVCARPSMSVVEDNSNSPMSSRKGSSSQVGNFPSQNGVTSKDAELLEVRPVKLRKKMIDLHLPADEYIDTEETVEFKDNRVCGTSSYLRNGDLKTEPQGDSLRIGSGLRSTNCLADLNEPIKAQETNGFAYGYPRDLCNGEIQGQDPCVGRKTASISLTKEISRTSGSGREPIPANSLHANENGCQKVWPPQPLGAGHYAGSQKTASPFLQPAEAAVSSQAMQVSFNRSGEAFGFPAAGQSKADVWRERAFIDLEADNSSHDVTRQNHLESSVVSNTRSSHRFNPPDSVGPWNHLRSARENPSCGFPQRPALAQTHPFLNSSETFSSNSQRHGLLADRFPSDSNSRFNPVCGNSSWSKQNGFYHGSSSASKENPLNFSAISYNYANGRSDHSVTVHNFKNQGPVNPYRDSSGSEVKFARDVNLNVAASNGLLNEVRQDEGHPAILPWLKPKHACKSEMADGQRDPNTNSTLNSTVNPLSIKADPRKTFQDHIWSQSLNSDSCPNNIETKKIDVSDCSANRKILGHPIFDEPCSYKDKPPSRACLSVSCPSQSNSEKSKAHNGRMLDINLPCDLVAPLSEEERSTEDQTETKVATGLRCQIDLNLSVSEGEDSFSPLSSRLNTKVPVIDLEAPAVPESDEDDVCGEKSPEQPLEETLKSPDELAKIAAEAIVALSSTFEHRAPEHEVACSSPPEASGNILHWFAETIYSYGGNLDRKLDTFLRSKGNENNRLTSSVEEIDYFESMTLLLPDVKEDEYMPKPLVPEDLKFEEPSGPATLLSQRPRRGNARRGRQRRDFQRDILPGLASLSRHEVTEDLQTFGGLMRATGIVWSSGLTRRKTGSTRGRRRLITANPPNPSSNNIPPPIPNPVYACPSVQHLNNNNNVIIEAGLEDRSLAGWGKTTRRPRRQRCPAGNRLHAPLT